MGSQRVRHKWMTNTHTHTHIHTFTTPEHPASLPVNTPQQGNHDADFHLHRSVLLVSEFNITGIKQFIFFSDWFLSLSIKHVQRIHGASLVGQMKIRIHLSAIHSVQFSSVAQSCPTLCDPMNRNTPGLPVHHQLPEFTQTHVHWVSDAIQP